MDVFLFTASQWHFGATLGSKRLSQKVLVVWSEYGLCNYILPHVIVL